MLQMCVTSKYYFQFQKRRTCINFIHEDNPRLTYLISTVYVIYVHVLLIINGTVSAKIAPRLKCYKNASRLNRYNFPMDIAIDFLFSTLNTTPFHYDVLKLGSR